MFLSLTVLWPGVGVLHAAAGEAAGGGGGEGAADAAARAEGDRGLQVPPPGQHVSITSHNPADSHKSQASG